MKPISCMLPSACASADSLNDSLRESRPRPATHAGIRHKDTTFCTDINKGTITADIDDFYPGNLPLFHMRNPHTGGQAALRVKIEEYLNFIAGLDRSCLLGLMQQNII